ncbi:UNVERIFIED_CONTAM: hypothetical protein GTU68_024427 [Idotea baltica]|nr:hypothetical protein [Idotea baltica]
MGKSYLHDNKQYLVIVTASDIYGIRTQRHLKTGLIIAGLISIILLAFIALLEARQFLKPISEKIEKAQSIGAENLHLRLNIINEQNELGQLGLAFNQMLDRLEDAFEMQKTFISNASHEIRNPLTAISGEVEVALEKKRSTEEYQQTLEVIQKEAERLGELVNNLLGLAKTGMDSSLIRKESLRMDELVFDLVKELSFRNPDHQLKVNYDQFPEDSDLLEFWGNADLLRMALGNILDNACKFSENQEVNLTLCVLPDGFQLIIKDQGVGIAAQDIKRINQPFFRGNNARHIQGFGIGLALTQKILDIHNGKIAIESEVGKGSTVTVFLPKQEF